MHCICISSSKAQIPELVYCYIILCFTWVLLNGQIFSKPQRNSSSVKCWDWPQSPRTCVQDSYQIVQLQLFPPKCINMRWSLPLCHLLLYLITKPCCKKLNTYKTVIKICMFVYSCVQIEHESCGIKSLLLFVLVNNIMTTIFILPGQLICTALTFH